MKLSDFQTADGLLVQLVGLGLKKIESEQELVVLKNLLLIGKGAFQCTELTCEGCGTEHRQVVIYSGEVRDAGDVGFAARIDESGGIRDWFAWESFGGTTLDLDPDLELFEVPKTINNWLHPKEAF